MIKKPKVKPKTINESVREIAKEQNIPSKLVKHIIECFLDKVKECAEEEREFKFHKMFSLKIKTTSDRTHHNIHTREMSESKGRDIPFVKTTRHFITKNKKKNN